MNAATSWWKATGWIVLLVFVLGVAPADSQALQSSATTGGHDWRSAPSIESGEYLQLVPTGASRWYRLTYRAGARYRIGIVLTDENSSLTARAQLFNPDLIAVTRAEPQHDGTATFRSTEEATWFLRIDVQTGERHGEPVEVRLTLDSGEATDRLDCRQAQGCALDDQLREVLEETAQVRSTTDAVSGQDSTRDVQASIDLTQRELTELTRQRARAESDLTAANTAIAELCAPNPTCTTRASQASTPWWAWLAGIAAAAAMSAAALSYWRRPL